MDYTYTYNLSAFPNGKCDLSRLTLEVRNSAITVALDYINGTTSQITIYFKAELPVDQVDLLDQIIANHSGEPLKDEPKIVKADILTEYIDFVESGNTTQGRFAAKSFIVDISSGETKKISDFSWSFDTALMSGTFGISQDMIGDEMIVEVGPNTLVGALVQPLGVGDTSIYCSSTVFDNIKIGYYLGMYNSGGDTGHELGQVLAKDEVNSTILIDTPSDVSANAGDPVGMCAKIIPYLYLSSIDKIEIGKQIPTGQRIPPNLPIRIHYFNNNGIAKKLSFFVEYLY